MKGVCGGEYQNKRKEPRPNFKAGCLKIKKLQPRCVSARTLSCGRIFDKSSALKSVKISLFA
jgi:hypothetical protein